jgi:hypothetical protein
VQIVKICLAGCDKLFSDPHRERQIRKTNSMEMSDFAPSDPKENHPPAMRLYGNVGP